MREKWAILGFGAGGRAQGKVSVGCVGDSGWEVAMFPPGENRYPPVFFFPVGKMLGIHDMIRRCVYERHTFDSWRLRAGEKPGEVLEEINDI